GLRHGGGRPGRESAARLGPTGAERRRGPLDRGPQALLPVARDADLPLVRAWGDGVDRPHAQAEADDGGVEGPDARGADLDAPPRAGGPERLPGAATPS